MRPKKTDPLIDAYKKLKPLLEKYASELTVKKDTSTGYELWTNKQALIAGKMQGELFFAAFVIQKNFVAFYYFPVYTHPELQKNISKKLLKMLKGKSCFHITNLDSETFNDISNTLELGFEHYKKLGWI